VIRAEQLNEVFEKGPSPHSDRDAISVVIPVYNCEECLRSLCQRLEAVLSALPADHEIILVEDRGLDGSWAVIRELARQMSAVRGLRLSRNFGQHAAITAGIARSTGSHVVVMDCDLQDPPEVIAELYERAREGIDVVFARRSHRQQSAWRRVASSLYFRFLNRFGDTLLYGSHGTFSIVTRKVADAFLRLGEIDRDYLYALRWLGFTSAEVDYQQAERAFGKSSYTLTGLVRQAVLGLLFHTTAFLRWIIYLGFSLAAVGIVTALVVLHRYVFLDVEPGWTSLALVGLLMGGANIAAIGVVGLYVGRIFEQVRDRPLYVVDEEAGAETAEVAIAVEALAARRSA
jgi:polyisoprenyl-phosphate glycosyltransferase